MRPVFAIRSDGTVGLRPRALLDMPGKATKADFVALRTLSCHRWCPIPCPQHDGEGALDPAPQGPRVLRTATQRLQAAALEDAWRVLSYGGGTKLANRADFTYDVWWVEGRRPSVPGFSLRDICASLELDYWTMREELLEFARRSASKVRRVKPVTKPRQARLSAA